MSTDHIELVKIRRRFEASIVPDLVQPVRDEVGLLLQRYQLEPNSRVGITAGSRGINDAVEVYQAAVELLKEEGHQPFLFSSMGSHGRGTADGQRDLLKSLGVSEEKIGAPVLCSAEVVKLGETEGPLAGLPVYVSKEAAEADGLIAIHRVKPHTSFHGPYESGLMKMVAVGMGRDRGASMVHPVPSTRCLGYALHVGRGLPVLRTPGGTVYLDRHPAGGGARLDQLER